MSKTLETSLKLRDQFTSTLANVNNGLKNAMSSMDNFQKSLQNQNKGFEKMKAASGESIAKTVQTVQKGATQSVEAVNNMKQSLENIDPAKGLADKMEQSMNQSKDVAKTGIEQIKKTMDSMNAVTNANKNPFTQLSSNAQEGMNQVESEVKSGFDRTASLADSGKNKIIASFANFGNGISSKISNAFNNLSGKSGNIAALKNIDDQINKLKQKEINIKFQIDQANQTKKSIQSIDNSIKKLQAQKAELKISSQGADVVKSKMIETQRAIDILKASKINLEIKADGLKNASSQIKDVQSKISELNSAKLNIGNGSSSSVFQRISNSAKNMGNSLKQSFNSAKASGDNFGNSMENVGNRVSSSFKSILGAIGVTKAISTAFNTVKASVGGAVDRFDTMQKFPKVTAALGFSATESSQSINKLSDGIDGLPTTLQDMVASTQQFTSITGDLGKSTDTVLGLNAAFLASGASQDGVSRGMQQYQQMMSTGVVDLESWKTLQETMPLALQKTAEAMGYTGKTAQRDLYSALKEGNVTFDQFQDKIIELGTGTGMLANLAKENSLGIRTSFSNLRNSVTKGLANMMTKADELTKKFTGKTIAQNIDGLKATINSAFGSIVNNMDKAVPYIQKAADFFKPLMNSIKSLDGGKILKGFADSFVEAGQQLQSFMRAASPVVDFIKNILVGALKSLGGGDLETGLGKLPLTIMKAVIGYKALSKVMKILPNIKMPKLPFFGKKSGGGGNPLQSFTEMFSSFGKNALNLTLVYGTLKVIEEAAEAMKQVNDKVTGDFESLASKLLNMGVAITGMGLLAAAAGEFASNDPKSAIAGLVAMAAISLDLMLAAEAMKQIDNKVPNNIGDFAKKLGNMAIAITGFGVLAAAVGALMSTGIGALVEGAGLLTIAAIALDLMLVAESIQQVQDKVPSNFSGVEKKLDAIVKVIQYMNNSKLGGVLSAIGNTFKSWNISAISGMLDKFVEMSGKLKSFETITLDGSSIAKVFEQIDKVVQIVRDKSDNMTTGLNWLGTVQQNWQLGALNGVISKLQEIAKGFSDIQGINLSESKLGTVFLQIDRVIQTVREKSDNMTTGLNWLGTVQQNWDLGALSGVITKLSEIGNKFKDFETIAFSEATVGTAFLQIERTIDSVKEHTDKITEGTNWLATVQTNWDIGALSGVVSKLKELGEKFTDIQSMTFSESTVGTVFLQIERTLTSVKEAADRIAEKTSYFETLGQKFKLGALEGVVENLKKLGGYFQNIEGLTFSNTTVESNMQGIASALTALSSVDFPDTGSIITAEELSPVSSAIDAVKSVGQALTNLMSVTPPAITEIQGRISGVKLAIQALSELNGVTSGVPSATDFDSAGQSMQSIVNLVPQINAIANATPQADAAIAAIKKIQEVLNTINTLNAAELPASIGGFSSLAGSMNQVSGAANGLVTSLSGISSSYSNMQTTVSGANTAMLTSTQTTFIGMNTAMTSTMAQIVATINSGTAQMASAFANGMAQSAAAVNNGKAAIIGAMSGLNGQLYSAGVFAMQGLTSGINAGAGSAVAAARSVANQVSAAVRKAMDIHSPSRVMAKLGGFITQGLAVGMINDLQEVDRASNQLAQAVQVAGANDLGFTSENSLTVDDQEISKIKAASTQQVIVNNKQLTPQVVINIENKDGEPIDVDGLLQEFEDKIIELMESDLG